MSTLKTINVIHPSGSTNNIVNDASGNVTIGGTVTAATNIGGTTASSSLTLQSTSGVGTSDSILLKVGNNGATTAMTVNTSGNVGIGTSSPGRLLTVGDGTGGKYAEVKGGNSGTSSGASLLVTLASTLSYAYGNKSSILGGAYDNTLLVYNGINSDTVFYTNNTEQMRIDSSGNVGIGTASPGYKLDVQFNQNSGNGIRAYNLATGASASAFVQYSTGTANSYVLANLLDNSAVPYFQTAGGSAVTTSYTDFTTQVWRSTGGSTEYMRINSSGNVGIGTASPSYLLHLNQAGNTQAWISATNAGTNSAGVGFENQGQRNWQIWADRTNDALQFGNNSRAAVNMVINSSGNVGIGTSSPNASAILDAQSTTKGVRFPNMTTTQKNAISSPAAGLVVFDTTLSKLCVYSGSAWQTITSI